MSGPRPAKILVMCAALLAAIPAGSTPASPTASECEQVARQLESHVAAKDIDFYINAFDWNALLDRMWPDGNSGQEDLQEVRYNLLKGLREGVRQQAGQFRTMKLLRVKTDAGEPRALMRVQIGSAFNYHELIFGKSARGQPKIVDAFIYTSGEKMSDTGKRVLIPILLEKNKSLLERIFSDTPDLITHSAQWGQLPKLNAQGKYREVLDLCAQLPDSLQREKFILVQRFRAAQAIDQKDYLAALELWRRTYPHDPSIDLISIDAFVLEKQYPEALKCVDRLDQVIGGDPYLDYQRALLFTLMRDPTNAKNSALRAFERDPSLIEAGFLALAFLAEVQQYDACVALLNEMQSKGGYSKERLARGVDVSKRLAFFSKSAEYRKWRMATRFAAPSASTSPSPATPPPGGLKLQSIIYSNPGASATINGQFVRVGDPIADFKVVAIEQQSVTLESASGEKKVLVMGGGAE